MEYRFSDKIASLKPSAIREVLKATSVPGMIPFAAGNPAPDAFPVAEVQEIAADILKNCPSPLQRGHFFSINHIIYNYFLHIKFHVLQTLKLKKGPSLL